MKSEPIYFCIILITFLSLSATSLAEDDQEWLSGYAKPIKGEVISYHSFLPKEYPALLVRSLEKENYIEWETQVVPEGIKSENISFVWIAAYDTDPKTFSFNLSVNDSELFQFQNPLTNESRGWKQSHKSGCKLSFDSTHIDRHEDQFGFMVLTVPRSKVEPGKPLRIKIRGESAGKRVWYMAFKYSLKAGVVFHHEPALIQKSKKQYQLISSEIIHLGRKANIEIKADGNSTKSVLNFGFNTIRFPISALSKPGVIDVSLKIGKQKWAVHQVDARPVKPMTIHLIHHSHVDIGYTHTQEDVKIIQFDNLELALDLVQKTSSYPEASRFKWNLEVMWPLEDWLSQASPERKSSMIKAIKSGAIELNGMFANELTGLCREEEMMRLFDSAKRISRKYGLKIRSSMITDIPGFSWGVVPAMAKMGIKYFSIGPNRIHRIGYILDENADKPFWWVSPSGKERILCWVHGEGYSLFHSGLGYKKLENKLNASTVFELLKTLGKKSYPYDKLPLRYNIGSDNGPPDPNIADVVKAWNAKYISPKMIITTNSRFFSAFEKEHGSKLPEYKGDFTGHWEDGAASTARETVINIKASERLIQMEKLWSSIAPESYPHDQFIEAWEKVLLYNEHTWGSWNSISDPDAEFTMQQWNTKKTFALDAEKLSEKLLAGAIQERIAPEPPHQVFEVFNSNSWLATGTVIFQKNIELKGDYVTDKNGRTMPSQRLQNGDLAVLVKDVPAMASRLIFFGGEKPELASTVKVSDEMVLSNEFLEVKINAEKGTVESIKDLLTGHQFVDTGSGSGLNEYFYVAGRSPEKTKEISSAKVRIGEKGPVIASVIIESQAPGCNSLKTEISLTAGQRFLDILNTIDKKMVRDPEGVHFRFPFNIENSKMHLDTAWGVFSPDSGQLPGSCKNYLTIQRWADISNEKLGVTYYSPDAPLIEIGNISADPISTGWKKKIGNSSTLYSYVMNNYWETNYKADQEGVAEFRYSLLFHDKFNPAVSGRFALNKSQNFIALPATAKSKAAAPVLEVTSSSVNITSLRMNPDGKAMTVRLFNSGDEAKIIKIKWGSVKPQKVFVKFPNGRKRLNGALELKPFEIVTIEAEL